MLQAHDVVAHEVCSDESLLPPSTDQQVQNGIPTEDELKRNGGEMAEVTRVRLVQFVKNTNEPLVSKCKFLLTVAIIVAEICETPFLNCGCVLFKVHVILS